MNHMLSFLARGKGKDGQAFDDYKPKFPKTVPYFLRDVSKRQNDFPPLANESKFRTLPGTFITANGQMMLYTRANKTKGIEKETVVCCKKISDLYDTVQTVNDEFRHKNIRHCKKEATLGDVHSSFGSLKNNWFYPKKWNSSAKELIPEEALIMGYDIKDFLINRNMVSTKTTYNTSNPIQNTKINSIPLPDINSYKDESIPIQLQNNAIDSMSSTADDMTIDERSISMDDKLEVSSNGTETPQNVFDDSIANSSMESFYECKEEIIIQRNAVKKLFHYMDDTESLYVDQPQIELANVLGGDSILNDIKKKDVNSIPYRQAKSVKNEKYEELRVILLKNLYEKLNFLSVSKHHLKTYSQSLLQQFQNYNFEQRKVRVLNKRNKLYQTLQEMKERNDEISLRIQTLSEKKILEKKDTLDKSSFIHEWDNMLLDLSRKSKLDIERLEQRKKKLFQEEELKIKAYEMEQLKVEHSSIVFAFTKLKNELSKLEEEKNDIEHFIIRLEMGRENVTKIEREMSVETPSPFTLSKINFQSYFKDIKRETVLNWKIKMCDLANDFKINESKLVDMLIFDCDLDSSDKGKGDINSNLKDINLNACPTETNESRESEKLSSTADIEDFMTDGNKSKLPSKNQKNEMMRLDYELMKMSQRISANHTYSYFIPWPKENYERDFVANSNVSSSDSDDETVKPKKAYKLNYKRILAHNPLNDKNRRTTRK